jgi:hypothetical protein
MIKKMYLLVSVIILILMSVGCKPKVNLPNPASVFCEENGGTLEIREDEDGNQVGYCLFEDDSECEEWTYYRGDCKPGDSLSNGVGLANPASVYCEENGGSLEIREDEHGGQVGYCLFKNGSECEEWTYYRDECSPGQDQ